MKRFIEGVDRSQTTLFPDRLEDWVDDDNPVQGIDVFVDELDLFDLGFDRVAPKRTGRPAYHPAVMLKLYIYGYLTIVCPPIQRRCSSTRSQPTPRPTRQAPTTMPMPNRNCPCVGACVTYTGRLRTVLTPPGY